MFSMRKIQEETIYQVLNAEKGTEDAKAIVYGLNEEAKTEDDVEWVKHTMKRMEEKYEENELKDIRMKCQCGYGIEDKVNMVKGAMEGASSMEEFANHPSMKEAGVFLEDGQLYLQFTSCACPMMAKVDHLESNTWCLCTTGYSKVLFEKAFGCKVDVELLKSIKMGDEVCLMKIIPEKNLIFN